ncbi:MAG TPA: hypothetical protein VK974_06560 [Methylophilaceae bacterium]|nr:hypothetical protein [Methylophilaceae bacterium]
MAYQLNKILANWVIPSGYLRLASKVRSGFTKSEKISAESLALLEKNKQLLNRHTGKRCFILGAGSSIAQQDLKKLAGEHVISVSNTFVHKDFSIIKPKYHVLPHLMHGHGRVYPQEKFVDWLSQMHEKTLDAEIVMHLGDKGLVDTNNLFPGRVIHWNEYTQWSGECQNEIDLAKVPSIWSVSELAITVALYLGYEKIYLLGFDHDWFNGLFVYFYDHNTDHAIKPNKENLDHVDAEFQMRRHAEMFKKYKCLYNMKANIYNANANPQHYLDVFPKVDFYSLFNQ